MNALQGLALWIGLLAVFAIFWVLFKAGVGEEEGDDPAGRDDDLPPPAGA